MTPTENPSLKIENYKLKEPEPNWADTPLDILNLISNHLDLIEWLAFRGVCRAWRTACSKNPSSPSSKGVLWSIIFKSNYPDCILLMPDSSMKYRARIPELRNLTCIASHSGWILAHHNPTYEFFFFHVFNGLRIDLPRLPWKRNTVMIGAVSGPPTDETCVACIGSNNLITLEMEIHVINRGESKWKLLKPNWYDPWLYMDVNWLMGMVYSDGYVCVVDVFHQLTGFPVKGRNMSIYKSMVPLLSTGVDRSQFLIGGDVFSVAKVKKLLGLTDDDPVWISVCGTVLDKDQVLGQKVVEGDPQLAWKDHIQVLFVEPRVCEATEKLTW